MTQIRHMSCRKGMRQSRIGTNAPQLDKVSCCSDLLVATLDRILSQEFSS
jgi:hypothetical protein